MVLAVKKARPLLAVRHAASRHAASRHTGNTFEPQTEQYIFKNFEFNCIFLAIDFLCLQKGIVKAS